MVTSQTETESAVTGLVLAGGQSTRFGNADENKAVATLESRTLLGRVVDVVTAATDRPPIVTVSTSDQREKYASMLSDRDMSFAHDTSAYEGPLAGVFGGLNAVTTPWIFCCGCDMPLLSPAAIEWLLERLADYLGRLDSNLDALAVRHLDDTVDPLHTLYRTSAVEQLRGKVSRIAGPRALLKGLTSVRTVSAEATPPSVPLEQSMTNVNTLEELKVASRHAP
jgi:molybdopterin-guanine dinucleotide biosynthesis protein A